MSLEKAKAGQVKGSNGVGLVGYAHAALALTFPLMSALASSALGDVRV